MRAPDGSDNLHMWNYVQIDGKWYGLDATANDGMKGGTDSTRYLLADKTVMGQNHVPDGVMSGAGFRFTYPQLVDSSPESGAGSPEEGDTGNGNTDSAAGAAACRSGSAVGASIVPVRKRCGSRWRYGHRSLCFWTGYGQYRGDYDGHGEQ